MRAASARAISSHHNLATRQRLERAVAWARQWSWEFPFCLANHLPMVLVALHRMGASDERLEGYCHIYREQNGLVPVPEPLGEITTENWREFLSQREREADYRAFFAGEVARLGATPAALHYLPQLMPGMAASATHAFMRMAYATMTDSDEETGVALAYWAATYLSLGPSRVAEPSTDDPAEVLAFMYGPAAFRGVEPERDLLWHFMRAIAEKPEFAPVVDMLAIGPDTHDRVARCSLALYAGTLDFCALHAVTGTHWLRLMTPRTPDRATPLRYFWQAIASLVPKIGFPVLPSADQLEAWRRMPLPGWPEIFSEAVKRDDEHDLSLSFSAGEEFKHYGDPLYTYAAAKRLNLV
ncbi:MAG: questin oxidase family protein [Hyphomicrobiales bacterium]|nr:questin oxidase family protein [Hyphomicrobiales bacterium]